MMAIDASAAVLTSKSVKDLLKVRTSNRHSGDGAVAAKSVTGTSSKTNRSTRLSNNSGADHAKAGGAQKRGGGTARPSEGRQSAVARDDQKPDSNIRKQPDSANGQQPSPVEHASKNKYDDDVVVEAASPTAAAAHSPDDTSASKQQSDEEDEEDENDDDDENNNNGQPAAAAGASQDDNKQLRTARGKRTATIKHEQKRTAREANATENARLRESIAKGMDFILHHQLIRAHSLSSVASRESLLAVDSGGQSVKPNATTTTTTAVVRSVFANSGFAENIISYLDVIKASVEDLYDVELVQFDRLQLTPKGFDIYVEVSGLSSPGALIRLQTARAKCVSEFKTEWYNRNFTSQQNKATALQQQHASPGGSGGGLSLDVPSGLADAESDTFTPLHHIPAHQSGSFGRSPSTTRLASSAAELKSQHANFGPKEKRGSDQPRQTGAQQRSSSTIITTNRNTSTRKSSFAVRKNANRAKKLASSKSGTVAVDKAADATQRHSVVVSIFNAAKSHESYRPLFETQLGVRQFLNDVKFPISVPVATRTGRQYGELELPYARLVTALFTVDSAQQQKNPALLSERCAAKQKENVDKKKVVSGSEGQFANAVEINDSNRQTKHFDTYGLICTDDYLSVDNDNNALLLSDADDANVKRKLDANSQQKRRRHCRPPSCAAESALPYASLHVILMTHSVVALQSDDAAVAVSRMQSGLLLQRPFLLAQELGSFYALFHRALRPYAATHGIVGSAAAADTSSNILNSGAKDGTALHTATTTTTTTMCPNNNLNLWGLHRVHDARRWLARLVLCGAVSDEQARLAEHALSYCAREFSYLQQNSSNSSSVVATASSTAAAAAVEKQRAAAAATTVPTSPNAAINRTRIKSLNNNATTLVASTASAAIVVKPSTTTTAVNAPPPPVTRIARGLILGYLNTHQVYIQQQKHTAIIADNNNSSSTLFCFRSVEDLSECRVAFIVEDIAVAISCLFDLADAEQQQQQATTTNVTTSSDNEDRKNASRAAAAYGNIIDHFLGGYARCGAALRGEERVAIKPLVLGWEAMNCVRNSSIIIMQHNNNNNDNSNDISSSEPNVASSRATWKRLAVLSEILL